MNNTEETEFKLILRGLTRADYLHIKRIAAARKCSKYQKLAQ